ncbi:MAG: hypothetical protein Ct9H300mP21_05170 [Pseudomonadota bacterium]|nr:MAG: hypothetical protein Ct9H300mP21_05170 [Pseudomonadota bacterium]
MVFHFLALPCMVSVFTGLIKNNGSWFGCFFGIGSAMTLGNWFALLHPIIPENIRGRFFLGS